MAPRGDGKCREMAEWSAAPYNHSTLSQRYWLFGLFREENNVMQNRERSGAFALPKTSAPSSGAGCYGDHLHGHARSSSDRAGSHGTVGTDTGNPSCSRSGNRNIPPDGRLSREKQQQGGFSVRDVFAYGVTNTKSLCTVSFKRNNTWHSLHLNTQILRKSVILFKLDVSLGCSWCFISVAVDLYFVIQV